LVREGYSYHSPFEEQGLFSEPSRVAHQMESREWLGLSA
jgi:hypothetical protein